MTFDIQMARAQSFLVAAYVSFGIAIVSDGSFIPGGAAFACSFLCLIRAERFVDAIEVPSARRTP